MSIASVVSSSHSTGGSFCFGFVSQTRTTFSSTLDGPVLQVGGRYTVIWRAPIATFSFRASRGGCSFSECLRRPGNRFERKSSWLFVA